MQATQVNVRRKEENKYISMSLDISKLQGVYEVIQLLT